MEILKNRPEKTHTRFVVAAVFLATAIFAVDLMLPMGTEVWLFYVALVLLCLWAPYRHYALVLAAACTVLIILGFLYCPSGISRRVALFNRSLGVLVIWATAILCVMRNRTEEALGKNQARLAGLIGSAMDAIVSINADQRVILFNAAAEKMFRCSADEVIGQPIDRFIPERFRNAHREHIRAFGEANVTKRSMGALGAIYGLRADGEEFPIEASISQVVADGQKLYTVVLRDISERRRVEAALRESEAHFRAVAESVPNAFVGTDSGGRVISWNPAAQSMFQYGEEEVLGQLLTMIMPERYRQAFLEGLERYQRTGIRRFIGRVVELHGQRKDGSEFPVEVSLSSWETDRGEVYHGIIRDITERKRLEQELVLRERSLNSFFTSAPAGLSILDAELRFLQINDTLAEMHGMPAQKHLGKTIREVLPKLAPGIEPIARRVLASGKPVLNFEVSGETPARPGVLRHWVASYFPIMGPNGKPNSVGTIVVEITERKRAEEELRSSHGQLRALAAHLQSVREGEGIRIAREIHDELSPALTALMMDLSQVASGLTTDQKPLVGKIEIMSKLVETTIQSMRKIAGDLRPGVLDDLGLVAAIEWQVQEFQTRTGIRCEAILPVEDIALDSARSTAIFRVSQEILTNVARHSRASRVNISLREEAGNVILEAQDNGKGISESEISNPKSLGLLGMRERALLFGGEVKISGIPGKGTTVTVRIPLQKI